jgi:D-xylonolactonase
MEKHGKLYLISPDGSAEVVADGIELSNGLGFSPDNRTLYYTDSSARRIYAYDADAASGKLSNRRVFVQVPTEEGIPDGLTVDADGYVWSAQWYGAQIVRYDEDGKVERRIGLPVTQVSSCQFGGPDLTDLYVTTAGNSWEGPYAPPGYDFKAGNIGGPLYRVRLDIQGKPEHEARF